MPIPFFPNTVIPSADDLLLPFDRRHPETEEAVLRVTGVDNYSIEQTIQISRTAPIRYCTLPEFYLEEAIGDYIPKDYLEEQDSYDVRKTKALSNFENRYTHLRDLVVGTALRKGVKIPDNASDFWKNFTGNCDLEGSSISSFAKRSFSAAIDGGMAGIWVEYPVVPDGITAAEEKRLNPRQYLVLYKAEDVLEVRAEVMTVELNGQYVLGMFPTYLRIKSEVRRMSTGNEFGETVIPSVNVYDYAKTEDGAVKVRYRLFLKDTTSEASVSEYIEDTASARFLSVPFIPFVPLPGGPKEAFFRSRPLLLDIARLNLSHWALACDLQESIHLTASPIPWATGIQTDETVMAGSGRMLSSRNSDAKFGMLSADMQGASITLQRMTAMEASMERLAAVAMTTGRNQAESGFSKLLDRSQSDSQLAVLVEELADSINLAMGYVAAYAKQEPIRVNISKNFIPVKLHSQQVLSFLTLFRDSGVIPVKLFLKILEAGEMFEGIDDFNVEDLLADMGIDPYATSNDLGVGGKTLNAGQIPVDNSTPASEGADAEMQEGSGESPESLSSPI